MFTELLLIETGPPIADVINADICPGKETPEALTFARIPTEVENPDCAPIVIVNVPAAIVDGVGKVTVFPDTTPVQTTLLLEPSAIEPCEKIIVGTKFPSGVGDETQTGDAVAPVGLLVMIAEAG